MSAADLGGFSLPTGPNLGGFDPFQQEDGKSSKKSDVKEHVHIRVQQRNGKKSLTTVQGLPKEFDLKKILKFRKNPDEQPPKWNICEGTNWLFNCFACKGCSCQCTGKSCGSCCSTKNELNQTLESIENGEPQAEHIPLVELN